jgi:putative ABC transport system ATP-binding protein
MSDNKIIFSMAGVSKIHPPNKQVLKNIYLSFFYGAKIGVLGLNGAGKSSLLKIIAGIVHPSSGSIQVDDADLHQLDDSARRNFRITRIGFVFQELELLEYLNVFDNILHTYRINPVLG